MLNTLLIVGAGFSKPYGFPSGEELVENIIKKYRKSKKDGERQLALDLKNHGDNSIDIFLSKHSQHRTLGLQIIAKEILLGEKISLEKNIPSEEDIVRYLVRKVAPAEYCNLRIISFNYDRLLEWRFLKRLNTVPGMQGSVALETFEKLQVSHVHGRLPTLTNLEKDFKAEYSIPYGLEETDLVSEAQHMKLIEAFGKNGLNTIYTNSPTPEPETVDTIKWAQRVFFLGFGFDEMNMKKLGIGLKDIHYAWEGKTIGGTAKGIPAVEMNRIKRDYPFLEKRLFKTNCKEFFEECFSIVDPALDEIKTPDLEPCCQSHAFQEQPKNFHVLSIPKQDLTCRWCGNIDSWKYRLDRDGEVEFCRTRDNHWL